MRFSPVSIHNLLQTYLTLKDCETSLDHLAKERLGYSLYAFVIRYQQEIATPQTTKVKHVVAAVGLIGFAFLLTNKR